MNRLNRIGNLLTFRVGYFDFSMEYNQKSDLVKLSVVYIHNKFFQWERVFLSPEIKTFELTPKRFFKAFYLNLLNNWSDIEFPNKPTKFGPLVIKIGESDVIDDTYEIDSLISKN